MNYKFLKYFDNDFVKLIGKILGATSEIGKEEKIRMILRINSKIIL